MRLNLKDLLTGNKAPIRSPMRNLLKFMDQLLLEKVKFQKGHLLLLLNKNGQITKVQAVNQILQIQETNKIIYSNHLVLSVSRVS
jgi:hypothetical protein